MDKVEEYELLQMYKKYCKNEKLDIVDRIDLFFIKRKIRKQNMKECYFEFSCDVDGFRGRWRKFCKVFYISDGYILISIDNKTPIIEFRWKYQEEIGREMWRQKRRNDEN